MKKKKIVLIGGGGHCKACIDVIEAEEKYEICGIVDIEPKIGSKVLGYKVLACDDDLFKIAKNYKNFFITIGQVKDFKKRQRIFNLLESLGVDLPAIVSPFSYLSKYARIGKGTIIMHGAFVSAGAEIGENCIINTGAIIEHESIVGSHSHISTGVIVNGQSSIGDCSFIGSNSVISNNIKIASRSILGAGTVVLTSISAPGTFAGRPARRVR